MARETTRPRGALVLVLFVALTALACISEDDSGYTPEPPPLLRGSALEPLEKPDTEASRPQGSAEELLNDPAMRGAGGWSTVEWYKPSDGKGEVTFGPDGVRFMSLTGNTRVGVLQQHDLDVSSCRHLVLTAQVKVDRQTLPGTGNAGREAPVAVFVKYTDVNGMLHELVSERPDEPRNMFWNGFYVIDPARGRAADHGTKVVEGRWYRFSYDLMLLDPKPKTIHFVGAEGAGWPVRDGRIGSLSLQSSR